MSLDISLIDVTGTIEKSGTGIFVREAGSTRELTVDEAKEKYPNIVIEPIEYSTNEVFEYNITHNLGTMASKADLYTALWRPDEQGWKKAKDITGMLERGLRRLKKDPDGFKKFNPDNGWGSYDNLVDCVEQYLKACKEYPEALIEVSR